MEPEIKHIAPVITLADLPSRYEDLINTIEDHIVATDSHVELPLTHTLTPGLYSREIFVPEGAVLTSKVHKQAHQFVLLKGAMIIVSPEGAFKITAPFHGTTMPGSTRIGIALEDSIWTTFHQCDIVENKEYTQEELMNILPQIEAELVEDRRPLTTIGV